MASELAALLALSTGKSKEVCEAFVKRFFELVSEELQRGESVRIKGFGSFKLLEVESRKSVNVATGEEYEIPAHQRVVFVASKELATQVNLPFEAFEAIELADEEDETDILTPDEVAPFEAIQEEAESGEEFVSSSENKEETAKDVDSTEETESCGFSDTPEIAPVSPDEVKEEEKEEEEETVEREYEDRERPGFRFAKGFLVGFVVALAVVSGLAIAAYYMGFFYHHVESGVVTEIPTETVKDSVTTSAVDSVAAADSIPEEKSGEVEDAVPTKASDIPDSKKESAPAAPVYDTVTTTRYLTTIAKEHYGNFNLWPIIYEENQAFLGHPDRIKPGTRVVVPPLSKYGIDPSNAEQVKAVKRKGAAIYARFKK